MEDSAEMLTIRERRSSLMELRMSRALLMPPSVQTLPEIGAGMEGETSMIFIAFSQSSVVAAESHAPSVEMTQFDLSLILATAAGSRSVMSITMVSGKTRWMAASCTQALSSRRSFMPLESRRSSVESSETAAMLVISWLVRCSEPLTCTLLT